MPIKYTVLYLQLTNYTVAVNLLLIFANSKLTVKRIAVFYTANRLRPQLFKNVLLWSAGLQRPNSPTVVSYHQQVDRLPSCWFQLPAVLHMPVYIPMTAE